MKFNPNRTGDPTIDRNFDEIKRLLGVLVSKLQENGNLRVPGNLGVGNSAVVGGTPGTIKYRIEVFDQNGISLGYLPVYNTIT